MRGASLERAAILAARVSGDSTVAYGVAFARAVEAALGIEAPARAHWLRGLMAELERLANHFGDIGAICNDAAFALMHAHCGDPARTDPARRQRRVRPSADDGRGRSRRRRRRSDPGRAEAIRALVRELRDAFRSSSGSTTTPPRCRTGRSATGVLKAELARQFGAGGFVGRASGRDFDARRDLPYPPYDELQLQGSDAARGRRQRADLGPDPTRSARAST